MPGRLRTVTPRALAVAIVLLAVVVRLGVLLATSDVRFAPHSDPADYDQHALSIAHGHGYPESAYAPGGGPTALRPPLYPYVLGGLYAVVGHSVDAGRVLSLLLGVLTVLLVGLVARQLAGDRVALWSMAVAALYPPLALIGATLISESLSLPLMLGAFAAALEHRRAGGRRWALLAGVCLGLGLLARPAMVVACLPVALLLWRGPRSWRSLAAPAIALVAALVVVTPWLVRDYDAFGAFVPISTQGSYLLAGTYNAVSMDDPVYPASYQLPIVVPEYRRLFETTNLGELAFARRLQRGALDYVRAHPGSVPKAVYHNTLRMLQLDRGRAVGRSSYAAQGIGDRWAALAQVAFYVLCLLALGALLPGVARGHRLLLWGTTALLLASVVVISSDTRYRLQFEPLLAILAGLALARARPAERPTRHTRRWQAGRSRGEGAT